MDLFPKPPPAAQPGAAPLKVFNGTYTIESPKGGHRTFRIRTQPEDSSFAPGKRVLSLLIGPDNEHNFKGFAFVFDDGIVVWKKFRSLAAAPTEWEVYARMLWSMATAGENPTSEHFHKLGYRLFLSSTCVRCNRKLTTPDSIRSGIGPECAQRQPLPNNWQSPPTLPSRTGIATATGAPPPAERPVELPLDEPEAPFLVEIEPDAAAPRGPAEPIPPPPDSDEFVDMDDGVPEDINLF